MHLSTKNDLVLILFFPFTTWEKKIKIQLSALQFQHRWVQAAWKLISYCSSPASPSGKTSLCDEDTESTGMASLVGSSGDELGTEWSANNVLQALCCTHRALWAWAESLGLLGLKTIEGLASADEGPSSFMPELGFSPLPREMMPALHE